MQIVSTDPVSDRTYRRAAGTVDAVGPVVTRHAVNHTGAYTFVLIPGRYSVTASVPGQIAGSHPRFSCPHAQRVIIESSGHVELNLTCNSDAG